MIKDLKKYQIKLTPFQAVKNWELDNVYNEGVLLLEQTASDGSDISLALEFYDYGDGSGPPVTGSDCDLALEQQYSDKILYRKGQNIVGTFYPDKDPINIDGTYRRSVYHQYKTAFYNDYRNPIQIWGVENIDFELSKTKRYLSDFIEIFDVPSIVYGDKIVPNTLFMIDRTLDDNYIISDDGFGNLVAGTNLFSRKQEVGNFGNTFSIGSDFYCSGYFSSNTGSVTGSNVPSGIISLTVSSGSAILNWISQSNNIDYFAVQRSLDGVVYTNYAAVTASSFVEYLINGDAEFPDEQYTTPTSWTVVDLSNNTYVDTDPEYVHSGVRGFSLGPYTTEANPNGTGSLSQVLTTGVGTSFTISFWLNSNINESAGNLFQVYWEGQLIADLSSEQENWTQYSYPVIATGATSELLFKTQNESSYYGLDDVSVWREGTGTIPSTFTDTDVSSSLNGNEYWYQVAGVNVFGTSSFSNTASITFVTPTPPPVELPVTLTIEEIFGASWLHMSTDQEELKYYEVYRSSSADSSFTLIGSPAAAPTQDWLDVLVSPGNTYIYFVDAVYSNEFKHISSNTASITF